MVAWIGVEAHLYPTITHFLYDIAGIFDARILLATAQEEHVELLVKRLRIRQNLLVPSCLP